MNKINESVIDRENLLRKEKIDIFYVHICKI